LTRLSKSDSKHSKPAMIKMLSAKIQQNPESIVVSPVAAAPGAEHTAVAAAALATTQRSNGASDAAVAAAAISAIPPEEAT
jgi:hypothetical protein